MHLMHFHIATKNAAVALARAESEARAEKAKAEEEEEAEARACSQVFLKFQKVPMHTLQ